MRNLPDNRAQLAWALPIDGAYLLAGLNAFAYTKATLSYFYLCMQRSQSSLGRLPQEFIKMVFDNVMRSHHEPMLSE